MTERSEDERRLVDARGLKCPWPVLRAARAMRECDAILLLADDPVALVDVPVLAKANSWSLILMDEGDHHRFQLSKTGR
ncbi:MAG TPA: sulfurtransferase TusA family protein [Sphingobium sp.]